MRLARGAADQLRAWIVRLFAAAIRNMTRPEDRADAIDWLNHSKTVIASEAAPLAKTRQLGALINSRTAAKAIAASVAESCANYRNSKLPLSVKAALPITLAAMPLVGGQAVGLAAFGSAIGVPAALLLFLGISGITAIIESVVKDPENQTQIAQIISSIIEDERLRRSSTAMKEAMRSQPADPIRFAVPAADSELRAHLLAMDPFDFERHVMSFFLAAGLQSWTTQRSNDFGVDGFAVHEHGLVIVQCKRNSPGNKIGRPIVQQFKGVAEEQNAWRAYVVTTSEFTDEARQSGALNEKIRLIAMDDLVNWHKGKGITF